MKHPNESSQQHLPHVVIVGGGFGGLKVAQGLANQKVLVTVVDQHNFHTFLPLLYQVATAGLEPADVAYPIRTIFRKASNISFRHGRVKTIDWEKREIITYNATIVTGVRIITYSAAIGYCEGRLAVRMDNGGGGVPGRSLLCHRCRRCPYA